MKVYVLIEEDFNDIDGTFYELLGVYNNEKKAERIKETKMNEYLKKDYIKDEESPDIRLFSGFQENWQDYIQFYIEEKEVE